jgi:hypothetical protein
MFIALAIVCDEFFVPSLDVIIEKGMYIAHCVQYVVVLLVYVRFSGNWHPYEPYTGEGIFFDIYLLK